MAGAAVCHLGGCGICSLYLCPLTIWVPFRTEIENKSCTLTNEININCPQPWHL